MASLFPALWITTIVSQLAATIWLVSRAPGRQMVWRQSILMGVLCSFTVVSGLLRFPTALVLEAELGTMYAILGSLIAIQFYQLALEWTYNSEAQPSRFLVVLTPLLLPVLVALLTLTRPSLTIGPWTLPWYATWVSITAIPAGVAILVSFATKAWSQQPNNYLHQVPWLLASALAIAKGVVWIAMPSESNDILVLLADPPIMLFWSWSVDRAATLRLTVENAGINSVVALRESLFLLNHQNQIDYANPAAKSVLGVDPQGATFQSVCPYWPCSGPAYLVRADTRRVPVNVSSAPIYIDGSHVGHAICASDVRELHGAMASAMKATEIAERAAKTRQEFLAVMSHEIRTPMNAIVGLAHLLGGSNLNPEEQQWIRTIQRSSDALLTMLNDVLDYTKLESGRFFLEIKPESPQEVVHNAIELIKAKADEKRIELKTDCDGLPPFLMLDAIRIQQIIGNLLSNAVKFTDAGQVGIEARHVRGNLEVHVSDTGIGISESQIQNIFLPFQQEDRTTSRRFGGTGLGLAISRRLADRMGGTLTVESTVGKGSRFTLRIPADVASPPTSSKAEKSQIHVPADLKVLIVEDNPVNRLVLKAVLAKYAIKPDEASDGSEGLRKIRASRYDIVFLDLQMPVMDGWKVLSDLQEDAPSSPPFIIVHSAQVSNQDMMRAQALGASAHLTKPSTPDDVGMILQKFSATSSPDAP